MKILLLNGPPRCGKDTIATTIARDLLIDMSTVVICRFADELKNMTHRLYGQEQIAPNHYEDCKDRPHDDFFGLTPRQAYIGVSERYMKPMHGQQIFGTMLRDRLKRASFLLEYVVIPDSGFESETEVLADAFGRKNLCVVHIHRPGTDFSKDSRSYINPFGITCLRFNNYLSLDLLPDSLREFSALWSVLGVNPR